MVAFLTSVEVTGPTTTHLRVPLDVPRHFGGRPRPPVLVRIGGHTFRATIANDGGGYVVPLSRRDREAAGVRPGDRVAVELEADTAPGDVEPPAELAAELAADQEARQVFGALSSAHRREYADWVAEAARPETRRRRAARAVDLLREGRTAR